MPLRERASRCVSSSRIGMCDRNVIIAYPIFAACGRLRSQHASAMGGVGVGVMRLFRIRNRTRRS